MKTKKFKLGKIQKKWIASLRKHPKRQMKDILGKKIENGRYKACCLGEGGLIAGVCEFNEEGVIVTKSGQYDNLLEGGAYKALGLRSEDGSAKDDDFDPLSNLNDQGTSWRRIATLLEKHPEQYFVKSI